MSQVNGVAGTASPLVQTLVDKAAKPQETTQAVSASRMPIQQSAVSTQDFADLSTSSSMLVHAMHEDDVRTGKVAALKASIESGSYQVPAADVAGKLISGMLR